MDSISESYKIVVCDIGGTDTVQHGPGIGWVPVLAICGSNQYVQIAIGGDRMRIRRKDDINPWENWQTITYD